MAKKRKTNKGLDQDRFYRQGSPSSLRRAAEQRDLRNQIAQEQKIDRATRKQLGMKSIMDQMDPRSIAMEAGNNPSLASTLYGKNRKLSGPFAYKLRGGAGGRMLRNPEALRNKGESSQQAQMKWDAEKKQLVEKTKFDKSRRGRGKTPKR
jgi:hypothetical protein